MDCKNPDEAIRATRFLSHYATQGRQLLQKPAPSLLQENWCKKGPPNQELLSQYRPQPPIQSDEPAVPPADPQKVGLHCLGTIALSMWMSRHTTLPSSLLAAPLSSPGTGPTEGNCRNHNCIVSSLLSAKLAASNSPSQQHTCPGCGRHQAAFAHAPDLTSGLACRWHGCVHLATASASYSSIATRASCPASASNSVGAWLLWS